MTIHLLGLEPIESRYTKQWADLIPKMFIDAGASIIDYPGDMVPQTISNSKDFLAWVPTNIWKASQLSKFSEAIFDGKVKSGDVVFVTDFWNPSVINIKYMADLSGIDLTIVGFTHAGFYDPWDRLGIELKNTRWAKSSETAIIDCYDYLIFATEFHKSLFEQFYPDTKTSLIVSPFFGDYIKLSEFGVRDNRVVFCQRNAPEKQPHLFDELQKLSSIGYEFVNTSSKPIPNKEMTELLAKSKFTVSFALQETLGIIPFEALAVGCCPIVPNRLSYSEMYTDDIKYDGTVEDANRVLTELSRLTQSELDVIILENFNKAQKFFDGSRTVEFIKGLT